MSFIGGIGMACICYKDTVKCFLQLHHWLWLLDSGLPGDLGQVGEWLGRAEALIGSDDIPTVMNEETASIISRKLEEHKVKHTFQLRMKYELHISGA
jgi:hypothetical protein